MNKSVASTISGQATDRFSGLQPLLERAAGKTVLDVGTYTGLIAFEFAKSGARIIHGIDFHEPGLLAARTIFEDMKMESAFLFVDLSTGRDGVEKEIGEALLPRYDILLFLAVYHKLRRVMSPDALEVLCGWLIDLTGEYIAVRSPGMEDLNRLIEGKGFRLIGYDAFNPNLAPLHIYKRV